MVRRIKWPEPEEWADGDYLSAASLNNHRDRLEYLYGGQGARFIFPEPEGVGIGQFPENDFTANQYTSIPVPVVDDDSVGGFQDPDSYIVAEEGVYIIGAAVDPWFGSGGTEIFVRLYVNEMTLMRSGGWGLEPGLSVSSAADVTMTLWWCRPGDRIHARLWHDSTNPMFPNFEGPPAQLFVERVGMPGEVGAPGWTTPITWTNGQVPTAAQLQAHLSDNMTALRQRRLCHVHSDAEQTTSGTGLNFLDLPRVTFGDPAMRRADGKGLVLPEPGIWLFGGSTIMDGLASGTRRLDIWKMLPTPNKLESFQGLTPRTARQTSLATWGLDVFAAGDQLQLGVVVTGGARTIQTRYPYGSNLWAIHLGEVAATAWTDPKTWEALEAVTALHADLNTYVRGNQRFLRAPPAVRVRRASNQSIPNGGAVTYLGFGTTDFDTLDEHDTGDNTRVTIKKEGVRLWVVCIAWASGTGQRNLVLERNGEEVVVKKAQAGGTTHQQVLACRLRCRVGDVMRVHVWQNSGGALNVEGSDATSVLAGILLSG